MRWSVEVTRTGKGEVLDRFCLEAKHWQIAVRRARELRGEGDSLEGLSVEASDEGGRALDGARRLTFVIARAAADAPLREARGADADAQPAVATSVHPTVASPVKGSRKTIDRAAASKRSAELKASKSEPPPAEEPSRTPRAGSQPSRPSSGEEQASTATKDPGSVVASFDSHDELARRTRQATAAMPLVHHERAYGLKVGLSKEKLRAFVLARLAEVRQELADEDPGHVVDLAVYAEPYEGTPEDPPILTLRWCDWREEPEITPLPYAPGGRLSMLPSVAQAERAEAVAGEARVARGRGSEPERASAATVVSKPAEIGPGPAPSAPTDHPDDATEGSSAAEEARRKVLPKAVPLKTETLAVALSAAAEKSAEPPPVEVVAAKATKADATTVDEDKGSKDKGSKDKTADPPQVLTSKRPLGSRRSLAGRATEGDTKTPAPAKAETKGGPVAGSKPAAKTLLGGGSDAKSAITLKPAAGRGPEASPKLAVATKEDGASKNPATTSTAAGSKPTRTVVGGTPAPGRAVAASAASFESAPSPRPRSARSGGLLDVKVMSREEKEARHQSARVRASTLPPPPARDGQRVAGDQLIADLFESLSELSFLGDALEGASFVLSVALEKLPSEVGMVSLFDLDRREYVVVRQEGGKRSALLLRASERAPLPLEAMKSKRVVVVNDGAALETQLDVRWKEIGSKVTSLLCAPIEMAGRTLGLVELANPRDGEDFSESDGHALSYISEQYAKFLDSHGVLLDPDAVLAAAEVASLE